MCSDLWLSDWSTLGHEHDWVYRTRGAAISVEMDLEVQVRA
jgi:hypothetical protein